MFYFPNKDCSFRLVFLSLERNFNPSRDLLLELKLRLCGVVVLVDSLNTVQSVPVESSYRLEFP